MDNEEPVWKDAFQVIDEIFGEFTWREKIAYRFWNVVGALELWWWKHNPFKRRAG